MFTPRNPTIFGQYKSYPYYPDTSPTDSNLSYSNQNINYNHQINQYQEELKNYERTKKRVNTANASKFANFYHFNYSEDIDLSQDKKVNSEKKINLSSDFSKTLETLVRIKKESNLHYVGFENNYGDNSCYINVILHFLYQFPSVNDFLIKKYIEYNNDNFTINSENDENCEKSFFFLLGKTLSKYQSILSDYNNKGIIILHTTELRQYLHLISNKIYTYNAIGDPVELLTFILDKLNLINKSEVHKDFFINLIEEIKCDNFCENVKKNKYDENTFIYQIYINEIIQKVKNLEFNDFYDRLFYFSKKNSIITGKRCEKCHKVSKQTLKYIGPEYPKYFLINLVWSNRKPELLDVLKVLYLLPLEKELNQLFEFENENPKKKPLYSLSGIIFYSGSLCHYISVIYNMQKNKFVLYNDDQIKELPSIHDVYLEITAKQIKKNSEAFYYPVLLIYYKDILLDSEAATKLNIYSLDKYFFIQKECINAKKYNIALTEEQKRKNFEELKRAQIRKMTEDPKYYSNLMPIEDDNKYSNENSNNMNNNFNKNGSINNDMDIEDESEKKNIFRFDNDNDDENNNQFDFKRISKKSMTDTNNYNQQRRVNDFFWNII